MILITGANGFVGHAFSKHLLSTDHNVRVALRKPINTFDLPCEQVFIGDINAKTDWYKALTGIKVIVHCAARVHVMSDSMKNPLEAYRSTNVEGTLNLASQAVKAGVRRFIFLSSIKVNGESTVDGKPFFADGVTAPIDPYGISKKEAEDGLLNLGVNTSMEIVIIRPPLIYGVGVKANFLSLMKLVNMGLPLPLGGIHNQRSFIALDNLVDLMRICLTHPNAANETFLVSDGKDVSTPQLLSAIAIALHCHLYLIPLPLTVLRMLGKLTGQLSTLHRLCENLQVDIQKTKIYLGWKPPISLAEGLKKIVQDWRKE